MASNPVRVSQLIDSPSPLTWQESVALVRGIAAIRGGSPDAAASGTFEEFAVQENGEVTAVGTAPPLSVSELALLLARLLPSSTATTGDNAGETARAERPPAALYFTIARALALVDAPSFASMQDFSSALARFERARPTVLLCEVFKRHTMAAVVAERTETSGEAREAAPAVRGQESPRAAAGDKAGPRVPDRRRQRMPSDVLRRMLREEDRRNFLEMRSRTATTRAGARPRQTGPDAQMLRRFIREADERTYALMRDRALRTDMVRSGRSSRRAGYHAAFVLLALLVAAVGFVLAGWQRTPSATVTRSTVQHATALPVAPAIAETAAPLIDANTVQDAPTAVTTDAVRPSEPPTATPPAAAVKKPAKTRAVVGTSARIAPPPAKRRGPVPRLFAAIYHRLGGLVRRNAAQPASQ